MSKKIIILLNIILINFEAIAFATEGAYEATSSIAVTILNIFTWVGYAVAFGMLLRIAIKYMTSAANEKANLKNSFVKYIIGVFLIILASTIAAMVSNLAAGNGDNTSEGLVDKGFEMGDLEVGDKLEGENTETPKEEKPIISVSGEQNKTEDESVSGEIETPSRRKRRRTKTYKINKCIRRS